MSNLIVSHRVEQLHCRREELLGHPSPDTRLLLEEALEELQRQNDELAAARENALADRQRYRDLSKASFLPPKGAISKRALGAAGGQ